MNKMFVIVLLSIISVTASQTTQAAAPANPPAQVVKKYGITFAPTGVRKGNSINSNVEAGSGFAALLKVANSLIFNDADKLNSVAQLRVLTRQDDVSSAQPITGQTVEDLPVLGVSTLSGQGRSPWEISEVQIMLAANVPQVMRSGAAAASKK